MQAIQLVVIVIHDIKINFERNDNNESNSF